MNAKGFSLIEVLISLVIISVAALVAANFDQFYVARQYGEERVCQAHAESIISLISQETYYRTIAFYMPETGSEAPANAVPPRAAGGGAQFSLVDGGVNLVPGLPGNGFMSNYWGLGVEDEVLQDQVGAAPRLHNNLLIQGSLRTLTAIYNNRPALRCVFGAYAPLTNGAAVPMPQELQRLDRPGGIVPRVLVKLQPYNVSTGAEFACPASIMTAPMGGRGGGVAVFDEDINVFNDDSGVYTAAAPPPYKHPSDTLALSNPTAGSRIATRTFPANGGDVDSNNGMIMTVQVDYEKNGAARSCFATQKFEYPRDLSPPPLPNRALITRNDSIVDELSNAVPGPVLRDWCDTAGVPADGTARADIEVGYQNIAVMGGRPEGGTQLLCKDLSYIRQPDLASGVVSLVNCRRGATAGDPGVVRFNAQPFDTNPARFREVVGGGFDRRPYLDRFDDSLRQDDWKPCFEVQQCGVTPVVTPMFNIAANDFDMYYILRYDTLPPGCKMSMEVVAVDTAGNRSGTRATNTAGTRAFLDFDIVRARGHYSGGENPLADNFYRTTYPVLQLRDYLAVDDEIYYPTCGNQNSREFRSGLGYWCAHDPAYVFPGVPVWTPYYRCDNTSCYTPP